MLDFSARASPSLRNPTSFCYKSLLFGELLQVAIAICVRKIIEDYLFQALGIPEMDVIVSEQYPGYSPYYCRDIKNEIANISGNLLIEKTNNLFPNGFKGKKIELSDFYLPWERIHELGFKLEFIEN